MSKHEEHAPSAASAIATGPYKLTRIGGHIPADKHSHDSAQSLTHMKSENCFHICFSATSFLAKVV